MMKRVLASAAALALCLTLLAGCGSKESAPSSQAEVPAASSQQENGTGAGRVPSASSDSSAAKDQPQSAAEKPAASQAAASAAQSNEQTPASAVQPEQAESVPAVPEANDPVEETELDPDVQAPAASYTMEGTTRLVTLDRLPADLPEFELAAADLSRPETTCTMFLCALGIYLQDADDGVAAMDILRGPRPMEPYDIQFLRDRMRDKAYLATAYFEGSAPENNYTPEAPYVLKVLADPRPQDVEEGYLRVYVQTSGADSPRPIKLREKDGSWYLWEYSSVLSGIRLPKSEDAWA